MIVILIKIFTALTVIKLIFEKNIGSPHSNWNTLIYNFQYDTKEFYERLKFELMSHGIKNVSIKEEIKKEGGVLSHSRLYLRATWRDYEYDICAAKFGNGFFVSWWLLYKSSIAEVLITKIPFIGPWLVKKIFPVTYFRIDCASMFMSYAQTSVLKVIDDITKDKGTRSLSELERKPILNNVFKR